MLFQNLLVSSNVNDLATRGTGSLWHQCGWSGCLWFPKSVKSLEHKGHVPSLHQSLSAWRVSSIYAESSPSWSVNDWSFKKPFQNTYYDPVYQRDVSIRCFSDQTCAKPEFMAFTLLLFKSLFNIKINDHNLSWWFFFLNGASKLWLEDGRETTELAESEKKHRSISSTKTLSGLTFHGLKAQQNIFPPKKTLSAGFDKNCAHANGEQPRGENLLRRASSSSSSLGPPPLPHSQTVY